MLESRYTATFIAKPLSTLQVEWYTCKSSCKSVTCLIKQVQNLATVGHIFFQATNFASGAKREFIEIFSQNNIGGTLYNKLEFTHDGVSVNVW